MSFSCKSAIVTGGTRGIGFAIAERLLARGCSTFITGRTDGSVREGVGRLTGHATGGAIVAGAACDVRDPGAVREMVAGAVAKLGGLDVLVNNAGVGSNSFVVDMPIEEWRTTIETNLSGVFYCCHESIPHLKKRGAGYIINIGSLAGRNAFPGGSAYNASKFGLIGFSEALMQEVRHDNIRVSYIMPGSVATEFDGASKGSADWKVQPEDIAEIVLDLLSFPARTLPSRVEVRPTRPPKR